MLFIGIALLIAVGLALIISADAGSLVGMSEDQTGQLVPLLLILILVAGGVFGRRISLSEMVTSILLWVGIFGIVVVGYTYRDDFGSFAGRVAGELSPGTATISKDGQSATFFRSMSGSFQVSVLVENVKLNMIFDTGASVVVLSHADAEAIGINVDNLRYDVRVQTANGLGRAASAIIKNIMIGGIERLNIRAFVAEEHALETSLLGMSFLETLSYYSVSKDRLELRD